VAALVAAVALIGLQLARGGLGYGIPAPRDPCVERPAFAGDGLDATAQRVALRGLDTAACRLGVTREALVLDLAGRPQPGLPSDAEVESAVREGLSQALDREELNPVARVVLQQAVERTPVDWALAFARRAGLIG
jgi:hypothetical protein